MPITKNIFVELITANKGIIYKISHAYARGADQEDLAQEIVYHLWKSYQNYNPEYKFTTWMYRVALNVAISYHGKNKRTKNNVPLKEAVLIDDDDREATSELNLQYERLFQLIGQLKAIDRSLMLLYLDNKSHREIAEITGISESNVSTKMARIRDRLKLSFKDAKTGSVQH